MALALITAPTVEPITLAEAKTQCRVDSDLTDDDGLLGTLISAAREHAENLTKRAFISQTWEKTLDAFPGAGWCAAWPTVPNGATAIPLAMPPLLSVVSVKYVDTSGVLQTLDPASYKVDDRVLPGWVVPAYGYTWPTARLEPNAVRIRFTAGYGAAATDVPTAIKAWVKLAVATLYKHRETTVVGKTVVELNSLDSLLDRYVVKVLA